MLSNISTVALLLGGLSAVIIGVDIYRLRSTHGIMNIVWPITGLYLGPIGLWAYWKMGRSEQHVHNHSPSHSHSHDHHEHNKKPFWQSVFTSTTHCAAGCAVGDLIGVPIVVGFGLTIIGSRLFADYAVEFTLAYLFGLSFQLPMVTGTTLKERLYHAIKADTFSLVAYEVGMFTWMALVHFVFFTHPPEPTTPTFWFMMQIALIVGFITSYPANWWVVQKGIKHQM
ncbi:DUF4396 domain-containing protein [Marininema halotolerans]|uniref:DUF4396 domain-containing protein n=1 Tax=Marininema halotolerans TaxID=1155944 RepID=A0A1I6SDK5_9BACL|nr:DUF4396 domain-containing protein [Marininema halotolerans]SFS74993.1 protein of unknown function [Marininema halotolerans]